MRCSLSQSGFKPSTFSCRFPPSLHHSRLNRQSEHHVHASGRQTSCWSPLTSHDRRQEKNSQQQNSQSKFTHTTFSFCFSSSAGFTVWLQRENEPQCLNQVGLWLPGSILLSFQASPSQRNQRDSFHRLTGLLKNQVVCRMSGCDSSLLAYRSFRHESCELCHYVVYTEWRVTRAAAVQIQQSATFSKLWLSCARARKTAVVKTELQLTAFTDFNIFSIYVTFDWLESNHPPADGADKQSHWKLRGRLNRSCLIIRTVSSTWSIRKCIVNKALANWSVTELANRHRFTNHHNNCQQRSPRASLAVRHNIHTVATSSRYRRFTSVSEKQSILLLPADPIPLVYLSKQWDSVTSAASSSFCNTAGGV